MTKIKIKNSTTASGVPISGSLLQGELAVNITDKKLFVGNASGNPLEIGGAFTALATGSVSGISISSSGPYVLGLQTNVLVSGSLSASGVLEGDQSAINVYAAEGTGGYSQWMKFKDYAGYYSKIMGADDGAMYFQNKANTWNFIPSGAAAESVTLASGTLILGTPDLVTPLAGTGTVFNTNAIAINMGGAASQLSFGAASSTSTFKGSINATGSIFNNGPISTTGYVSAASGYRLTSSAVNAQTGTTYTLLSTDDGRIITMNNGSSITVTVPTGLNIGFNTTVIQLGAGQVTFATGVGSPTLNSYGSAQKITGQYGAASIISYASNSYNLAGTLST